jgi:hypothetical protein
MQKTVDVTIPINPAVKGTRLVTLWPEVERASINGVPNNEGTRFDIIGNQCASFMVHVDDLGEISLVEK